MGCDRGKANPDTNTQRQLFAASGGYCQNPGCNRALFVDTTTKKVSVAEMAHIFAAQDDGPRANTKLTEEERGSYRNLILLCSLCHTIVDKAPQSYSDATIFNWKSDHEKRIAAVFGSVAYESRADAHRALAALMARTSAIHQRIGPDNDYKWNPEADEAIEWRHQVRQTIIPTNRSILALLDRNRDLLYEEEIQTAELLRQHIEGVEQRHIFDIPLSSAPRYPRGMNDLLKPQLHT